MGDGPDEQAAYPQGASPFKSRGGGSALHALVPVSGVLRGYDRAKLRRDVVAGLTVAALAVPSGIAFAELAGLSPVAGLYALLLPSAVYGLLGSSRQLIIGPEGSIAALVAAAVVPLAAGDPGRSASLAALLALLVAGVFVLAWVARLGWIADYFSRPVLTGYINGIAVVLIVGQLGKLLGLDIEARDALPQLAEVARELPGAGAATIAVGLACLMLLLALPRVAPRVPGSLVVLVVAIAASAALELEARGVATVGEVPAGLPGLALPSMRLNDIVDLLPAAVGIFLVCYADQILTARSFAGRHGQHVRAGQELLAMGLANAAAGITRAFPVGASGSRTAVNDQSGGRTQLSGLVGAVIVAAAVGLVTPAAWRTLWRASRAELLIAATTTVGVVLVGVLEALVVAVALSVVDVVRRSASPHDAVLGWVDRLGRYADVRLHPSASLTPGVLVYRLDDRLFFANASYVRGRVHEAVDGAPDPVRWLVFDAEALSRVDATGVHALEQLVGSLRQAGITFPLARLTLRTFRDAGLLDVIGEDHVHPTIRSAVKATRPEPEASR
jgi:SulP family sulfate permease